MSWSWPGLMWQAGWVDRVDVQVQVPCYVHSTGLTPLHTAVLALNAAMLPASVCPRMQNSQARDRLTCVQMLLQMGASHTSQVSLGDKLGGGGETSKPTGKCVQRATWMSRGTKC